MLENDPAATPIAVETPPPAATPEEGKESKGKKDKKEKRKKDKKDKKAKAKDKKKDKKKKKKAKAAESADKYVLYQRSVQAPDADIEFIDQVWAEHHTDGSKAATLREDFCGAYSMCCEWVKTRPENKAWGVDLDPEPIGWGTEHNLPKLNDEQRGRVKIIQGDVRDPRQTKVDVVAAQNFSFCIFKTRDELKRYFEVVREAINPGGLFVLDIFGGPESQGPAEDETDHDDFIYVWDQKSYDAINNHIQCAIHFKFPDGSKVKNAFTYDWRLWTIAELKELLLEVGFARADAYWEGVDEDDPEEGNGEFTRQAEAANEDAWIAYVVGVR
jgi:SAM-dependent methyltransferase